MSPEIIKVCGITSLGDGLLAAGQGANALGLIFFEGSPRCVAVETAARIASAVPRGVLRVGLFVNESAERIREVVNVVGLDIVQLHGDERPEECAALGDLRIWKAFRVGDNFSLESLRDYRCEAFLLDAAAKDGSYGGSGQTFPWSIAIQAKHYGRIVLAGGLHGGNVAEAIRQVQPWGIDASSKLEQQPGVKDPEKVRQYLEAAKSVK